MSSNSIDENWTDACEQRKKDEIMIVTGHLRLNPWDDSTKCSKLGPVDDSVLFMGVKPRPKNSQAAATTGGETLTPPDGGKKADDESP